MAIIHVEPELMQQHGRNLILAAGTILEQVQALSASSSQLEMGWQGGASSQFLSELADRLRQMELQAEQMHAHGVELIRQAEMWLELDQRWTSEYAARRGRI